MTGEQRRPDASGRDRILAAAEELFAEHGFDGTSAARLARAAQVPQGLIFYHFGTKQNLLLQLVRERSDTALTGLLPEPRPAEPRDAVAELWRRLRDQLGTPSPLHRIVFRELDTHPELREHALQFERDTIGRVARYLAAACAHDGPPTPVHLAAARLLTVAASVASITHGDGGHGLAPDVVADLLTGGLAAP
ncbi:TetR/AcrR family transcriptional regulator [Pseudonocardia humida]|uniref:TetR/AcrR family transcriptional regulator n=1 Tax=Pseudonocardia humida TaxID=2800819 RepID=A0ABT1A8D7_9PSEU|nr:TetR/AcrR family transcriptional regulator [Pseudonocardia humida]MCO1659295.1 TetR/AcrR family transcriptional regulator [Pseudonocardia humida]